MIVRILGEGQWEFGKERLEALNALDDELTAAIERGDEAAFRDALAGLLDRVHEDGEPVPDNEIHSSELVLPPSDATLDDVRAMLGADGLVPG